MRKLQRWLFCTILLLGIACVGNLARAESSPAQWPMFQSDAGSSGHAWRHSGPDDALCLITEKIVSGSWTSPVVVGPSGEIYMAGSDNDVSSGTKRYFIYSLRVSEEKLITVSWRYELRAKATACPAVNEFGNVLVLDQAGNLYAFDDEGNTLWVPRNLMLHPGGSVEAQAAIRFAESQPWGAYVYVPNYRHPGVLYKISWLFGVSIWQTDELVSSWNRQESILVSGGDTPIVWFAGYVDGERVLASVDGEWGELIGTIADPLLDAAWYDMRILQTSFDPPSLILLGNSDHTVAVSASPDGDRYSILWDVPHVYLSDSALTGAAVLCMQRGGIDVVSVDLESGVFGREFLVEHGLSGHTPPIVDGEQRIYFLADSGSKNRRRLVCYNAWGTLRFDIEIPGGGGVAENAESMAMVAPEGFAEGYWRMEHGGLLTSFIIIPLDEGGMAVVFDRTM
jgi:hypothetical protein